MTRWSTSNTIPSIVAVVAVLIAVAVISPTTVSRCSAIQPKSISTPIWKFDFGPGAVANGYKQVLEQNFYSLEAGFGFEPGPQISCINRCIGRGAARCL